MSQGAVDEEVVTNPSLNPEQSKLCEGLVKESLNLTVPSTVM